MNPAIMAIGTTVGVALAGRDPHLGSRVREHVRHQRAHHPEAAPATNGPGRSRTTRSSSTS